ncbi:AI-2E family transporter [Deinococcus peraridilitoris]
MNPVPEGNAFVSIWRNPYVRVAVFLLLAYLAYRFIGQIANVLILATVAYVIAYLANPLLVWFERRRVRRGVGILFVLLALIGLLALASTLLVAVIQQFANLIESLPQLVARANELILSLSGWLERFRDSPILGGFQQQITSFTQSGAETLQRNILPFLQRLVSANGPLVGGLSTAAGWLGNLVLILILSIYMMAGFDKIGLTLLRIFPRRWQPLALELSQNVERAVGGYLRGQILIAVAVGTMIGVGLAIVGVPQAAAIGFLAGIFNIVPYLGPIIGALPAILLALPDGWLKVVLVIVVFVAANQIEGNFLSPYILGRTTDLHPITVLLSILIGLGLFGIVGALIAVPLAALGKLLLHEYYYPSRVYKGGP